ncbi:unnamed protein product [Arabis nemorensis]|uniref:RRM domain-containing protein n=1 Tax=Arabis nemorensis TaxID=586526 RepID=A0A565CQ51_9BRAS|nr:unnamed protein product [Arabis nemorensis]
MSQQNENQNSDTTYTKIFVGGLPRVTKDEGLKSSFQQFGEIVHVNVVFDKQTQRSKGYGFVTFKDAESATRACLNPNPIIEGHITNCKLASDGDNVNHNQSNQTGFPDDDLCWLSQSFRLSQQQPSILHQPLTIGPFWYHYYPQYVPQFYPETYQYDPQYFYPQYYPETYQYDHMVNNQTDGAYHSTNAVEEESSSLAATEIELKLPSTPSASSTKPINMTTDSMSDGSSQS